MSAATIESAAADADAALLDLLLTDAALGVLNRVNPGGSGLRLAAALAARPRLRRRPDADPARGADAIAAGTSQVQPSRRDRRFADPGWAGNPLLRRAMQAYLAAAQTAEGLTQDADLDWADTERVGFVMRNLIDALAPSNNPVLNPAALKAAIDTGGGSALAGLRHFAADIASPPRIPSTVQLVDQARQDHVNDRRHDRMRRRRPRCPPGGRRPHWPSRRSSGWELAQRPGALEHI